MSDYPRVGVRYLTDVSSLLLEDLPFQTLLINVSNRNMLMGLDIELNDYVNLPRYGMLLLNKDVPAVFGMTIKSRQDRSRLLFVATDEQTVGEDGGAIYAREAGNWVKAIAKRERN